MSVSMETKALSSFKVPVVAAPMFLVSGIELVVAAANAGIVGSFPTLNARTPALLDAWLAEIKDRTQGASGLFAANLILHPSNGRRDDDLDIVINHRVPWVITSVGSPVNVVERVHAYGGQVLADVATVRHARKAIAAGVDMLVLLTAGAGGNTGWINPLCLHRGGTRLLVGPLGRCGLFEHGASSQSHSSGGG
jgi:nitronate monooxygenase